MKWPWINLLFSSYSMNSTNSLIRPHSTAIPPPLPRTGRHSTGSRNGTKRDSKRLSGHHAVERTVTQITYCSDNADSPGNRDSGLVESTWQTCDIYDHVWLCDKSVAHIMWHRIRAGRNFIFKTLIYLQVQKKILTSIPAKYHEINVFFN